MNYHPLCIKEIDLSKIALKDRGSCLKEVSIQSIFNHPHIVKLSNSFLQADKLFLLMEYADGGDLEKEIMRRKAEERPFTRAELITYYRQITSALAVVHAKNVVHRDVKPHNIFIFRHQEDSGFDLKIGDFGISKILG